MNKKVHIDSLSKTQIENKLEERNQSKWLPLYHISPPFGLLNDPNGLSFINKQYNIFFQWYPGGPTHGLKHWFKLSSKDLINFNVDGVAMKPSDVDKDGVFSGSHFVEKATDKIVYTGTSEENGKIIQRQNIADLVEGHIIGRKLLIDNTAYINNEFRDPSWFSHEGQDYIIVGAKTKEHKPVIAVYSYKVGKTSFVGNISLDVGAKFDMVECPQIIKIENKYLLIMSPQGLEKNEDDYQNTFNVVYTLFEGLDLEKLTLKNATDFKEIDYGHDFYAPQLFKDDNKLILFAWAGCGKSKYPEQDDGWMNLLSMPREVEVLGSKLIQKPHDSIKKLRCDYRLVKANDDFVSQTKSFYLHFNIEEDFILKLGEDNDQVTIYKEESYLILDRSKQSSPVISLHGDVRKVKLKDNELGIFIDNSIIEIFLNNGENTMTSRVYCQKINNILSSVDFEFAEINKYNLEYEVTDFE